MAATGTNNNDNVYVAKPRVGGAVFVAPLGTPVPTDAVSELPDAFKCVGYISADGFETGNTRKSETKQAWGGDTVGSAQSEYADTATLEMLETTADNLRLVYGDSNVIEDGKGGWRVRHNSKELESHTWVVEQLLGSDKVMRTVIDKAQVSEIEAVKRNNEDFMSYKATLAMFSNLDGDTYNDYVAVVAPTESPEPDGPGGDGPEGPDEPGGDGGEEPAKALDDMTVDELKAYAAEHSIDLAGLTLKGDILAAIKAAESQEGDEA